MPHLLDPKIKGVKILFLTSHCNFKTLVARGRVLWRIETRQYVSKDIALDKITGAPGTVVSDTPYCE